MHNFFTVEQTPRFLLIPFYNIVKSIALSREFYTPCSHDILLLSKLQQNDFFLVIL